MLTTRRRRLLLILLAAGALPPSTAAAAPPTNDAFAARTALPSGDASSAFTTVGAGSEVGEPASQDSGRSVWFSWKAATSGGVRITACTTTGSRVEVFTGGVIPQLANLDVVGEDVAARDDEPAGPTCARRGKRLVASAGTTYLVRVADGVAGSGITGQLLVDQQVAKPVTTIPAQPATLGLSQTLQLTAGAAAHPRWECALEGVAFGAFCSDAGVVSFGLVPSGTYMLTARATDFHLNLEAVVVKRKVIIDSERPGTVFTSPVPDESAGAHAFAFGATESSTFKCSLDGATPVPCTSPRTVEYGPGNHSFSVVATDLYGNIDATPATQTWTRVNQAPAAPGAGSGTASDNGSVGGTGATSTTGDNGSAGGTGATSASSDNGTTGATGATGTTGTTGTTGDAVLTSGSGGGAGTGPGGLPGGASAAIPPAPRPVSCGARLLAPRRLHRGTLARRGVLVRLVATRTCTVTVRATAGCRVSARRTLIAGTARRTVRLRFGKAATRRLRRCTGRLLTLTVTPRGGAARRARVSVR